MKKYLTAFAMAQSMFCAIPCPFRAWDEKARPYMLLFLPAVGLEIGLLWVLMDIVLRGIGVPNPVYGLLMCALPYLVTGFIHLDGFMDVTDAVCSWRDLERRREILKDSHVGSFAVVWCIFLLMAGFACFSSVPAEANRWCLLLIPVISRCGSALAVLSLKPMSTSQYAQKQETPRGIAAAVALLTIVCVAGAVLFLGKYGFVLLGGIFGYGIALYKSYKSLQGMNGDISGFCLTVSELCAVAVFALL